MAMAPLHRQLPQARLRQQLPRPPPLRPRGRRAQQPRQDPPRLDEGRRPLAPAVCVCSGSSSSSSSSSSSGSSSGSSRRQRRQEAAAQRTEALCNHFKSDGPALAIGRRYQRIMRPRPSEGGYQQACQDFVDATLLAYSVGCASTTLRRELFVLEEAPGTRLLEPERAEECATYVEMLYVAILLVPKGTVRRWGRGEPLPRESRERWRGFVQLIHTAYFQKRMAWYDVRRLQLEQMAVLGEAEQPAVVSERMRLLFTLLNSVCPQFPTM